jgi:hypothetical protein
MDDTDFEGTLVLEQQAAIGHVDDFFDAVDSDDAERTSALMRKANADASTNAMVIRKMVYALTNPVKDGLVERADHRNPVRRASTAAQQSDARGIALRSGRPRTAAVIRTSS